MLRQDWFDFNIVPVIPYFGFDFRIIPEKDLLLKGNIARNYHQPSLNDLYWQPGGNPDLQPEKGFSYELGMEYRYYTESFLLSAEISAYNADIDNWIIWIPTFKGYWEPSNIERVVSRGIELSMKLQGNLGQLRYNLNGSYAYTSSVNYGNPKVWGDESYGKQLPYVPLHSGNLLGNVSWKGYFITHQFNSYSERFTTSSNDVSRRDRLYPYYMNDLSIGKELRIKQVLLTGEFRVYNLFDETYHTVLYRPMPGRNYLFTLMVSFVK